MQRLQQAGDVTALELGSGAVGMAGLSLAWQLRHQQQRPGGRHARVILTDHEPAVLRQLQDNVTRNQHVYLNDDCNGDGESLMTTVECQVASLDWGHHHDAASWNALLGCRLDLIFGSELVYTPETATACRDCILSLTERFPLCLVCIVQIVDREGWRTIFLPGLRQAGLFVVEQAVDVDCDAAANAMMKRGGSLDRFDFGICYMSRTKFT